MDRRMIANIAAHDGAWVEWDAWYDATIKGGDGDLVIELAEVLERRNPKELKRLPADRLEVMATLALTTLQELAKRQMEGREHEAE